MRRKVLVFALFLTSIFLPACGRGGGGPAAPATPGGVSISWVARYNGPINKLTRNGTDKANALAVDANGNVYVTGGSWGSDAIFDYATIKYDATGTQLWVARYDGPGNRDDEANALAVDANGNVYVTGGSVGSGTDYATIKYDATGTQLWVARYDGPVNSTDVAHALAVDANGHVYVTGESVGSDTDYDFATIKYDANDGTQLWVARYDGPGNGTEEATALAVDANGNVYVTGGSVGLGTDYDFATIKYDATGTKLWVTRYNGPWNGYDEANALAVDANGHVYVTGGSVGSGTDYDFATIKYDATGTQLWVARYDGPWNGYDEANALGVDANGNVYVTGGSLGLRADHDYATIKYDGDGNPLWVTRYNGPAKRTDVAHALAVDANGNVYVTGNSTGPNLGDDYTTIKYSQAQ